MLSGVLAPDRGFVEIDGVPLGENRLEALRRIGYLPEGAPLHADMRVCEELRYRGRLLGLSKKSLESALDRAIELAQLGDVRRRVIGTLSRGYRQRVGLAHALVADPPILILDEPTTGLDPVQRRDLLAALVELARDRTVVLSSHVLPEVDAVADRFLVLIEGAVAAVGTTSELLEEAGAGDLEAAFVHFVDRAAAEGAA